MLAIAKMLIVMTIFRQCLLDAFITNSTHVIFIKDLDILEYQLTSENF